MVAEVKEVPGLAQLASIGLGSAFYMASGARQLIEAKNRDVPDVAYFAITSAVRTIPDSLHLV